MAIYRIVSWEKYRDHALEFTPSIIYYAIDSHPLRNPPWGLKLIFYHDFNGYVFIDYADGATLYKTKIPFRGTDPREVPLLVEDIEHFIHDQI
ncbi:MAG: hypothetical protein JSV76_06665 [Candidatus Bathyarchaeota archaeon]|nr:MAG: hypothetical protein JSV76_06665 [Candidatus Bathyarchaeota archaeon]